MSKKLHIINEKTGKSFCGKTIDIHEMLLINKNNQLITNRKTGFKRQIKDIDTVCKRCLRLSGFDGNEVLGVFKQSIKKIVVVNKDKDRTTKIQATKGLNKPIKKKSKKKSVKKPVEVKIIKAVFKGSKRLNKRLELKRQERLERVSNMKFLSIIKNNVIYLPYPLNPVQSIIKPIKMTIETPVIKHKEPIRVKAKLPLIQLIKSFGDNWKLITKQFDRGEAKVIELSSWIPLNEAKELKQKLIKDIETKSYSAQLINPALSKKAKRRLKKKLRRANR